MLLYPLTPEQRFNDCRKKPFFLIFFLFAQISSYVIKSRSLMKKQVISLLSSHGQEIVC